MNRLLSRFVLIFAFCVLARKRRYLPLYIFSQRLEKELLYTCVDHLAVEVSDNSRDVKIQCRQRTEYSSSVVSVESDDFNTRTSFAPQYGNYMRFHHIPSLFHRHLLVS